MADFATKQALEGQTAAYALASREAMLRDAAGDDVPFEAIQPLGVQLLREFGQAENDRRQTEQRWLDDLRQYRGKYDEKTLAKIGEHRSKAFVRKTRVKVKTVDARMVDLLFPSNSDRNFTIAPTPVPSIPKYAAQQIARLLAQQLKRQPTKAEIKETLQKLTDESAKQMGKTIDDQLVEAQYKNTARQVIHSGNLYGTGVLKAPLVERKIRQSYMRNEKGKWEMRTQSYIVPFVEYVPLWRFYPDMAATRLEDCRYVFERHVMTKAEILKLAKRKSFDGQAIIDYVKARPDGELQSKYFDTELAAIGDRLALAQTKVGQYEIIERWGWIDAQALHDCGVKVPEDRLHETFFANVWFLTNGAVVRAVLQPINGVTWPYHIYYFDKDETSIFGEGLASIMRDDQTMLNAAVRMILDNSALTAGPMLEVNTRLVGATEQINEMFPFKVWARTGEDPTAQAVRVIDVPNRVAEIANLVSMFENNADEVTAIPRYMTGDNPNGGAAGTASGMSMLLGAASIVLKDLIASFDELTKSFILALYRWNMQFNTDDSIKGDFDVKASGVASMVAKEVRAQQLDAFSQLASNPLDAPYIKRDKLLRQRAEAHELSDVVKTEEEVAMEMNGPAAQQQMQLAAQQAQLEMAKLATEVAKLQAEVLRIRAEAVNKNVGAAYAAIQAGGVAVQSPGIAPAGDEILRSAGWTDATPETTNAQVVGPNPVPPTETPPANAAPTVPRPEAPGVHRGLHAGIETPAIEEAQ